MAKAATKKVSATNAGSTRQAAGARKQTAAIATIDAYIAAQPEASRPVLESVRAAIRRALPKSEETISYRIPAYRIGGKTVIYFAGFKQHYSIYPAGPALIAAFREKLTRYEYNEKGTIRFPLTEKVPAALITAIAKWKAKEVAG